MCVMYMLICKSVAIAFTLFPYLTVGAKLRNILTDLAIKMSISTIYKKEK